MNDYINKIKKVIKAKNSNIIKLEREVEDLKFKLYRELSKVFKNIELGDIIVTYGNSEYKVIEVKFVGSDEDYFIWNVEHSDYRLNFDSISLDRVNEQYPIVIYKKDDINKENPIPWKCND